MAAARQSLRGRLLLLLLAPLAVVLSAAAAIAFYNATQQIGAVDDAQLLSNAKVLRALVYHELLEDEDLDLLIDATNFDLPYEKNFAYRVWRGNDLIVHSENSAALGRARVPAGYSTQVLDGVSWRFYAISDNDDGIRTEVAERVSLRRQFAIRVLSSIFAPLVILFPLVLGVVSLGLALGLRPMRDLSEQVSRRSVKDLKPIDDSHAPLEVIPLVAAINALLARLGDAFDRERQFTDDAAHELRTPLAALKLQAQVVARATNDDERAQMLQELNAGMDRASRVVDQLLALARVDGTGSQDEIIDIGREIDGAVELVRYNSAIKGVRIRCDLASDLLVRGNTETIGILIRNLLENAIKFSPRSSDIEVTASAEGDRVTLRVRDQGPGIDRAKREKVFERFVRLGDGPAPGVGLGLTIVRKVAEIHGASITLSDNAAGSGLEVVVTFPRASEPATAA